MLVLALAAGLLTIGFVGVGGPAAFKPVYQARPVIWNLKNPERIGEFIPEILGDPVAVEDIDGKALLFDGKDDGLIIPENPVAGWSKFTIEILIKPARGGPEAPRYVHFQDTTGNRGTMEMRITPEGNWYMDTFLYNHKADAGLTLRDSTLQHPAGEWYWIALEYDGKTMSHYVNGEKELEGEIEFNPMVAGRISLGVRLNHVCWFKGLIRQIRFYPEALAASRLKIK